jgi:hypothetical protein
MSIEWKHCADRAEDAGDPLEGSAPPADHWFLIEHGGAWGRHVIPGARLDRDAVHALSVWAAHHAARVQLIRPSGKRHRQREFRRWYRIDSRPGHESVRTGLFGDEREIVDIVADLNAGEIQDEPLYLVCTHGRHDPCCAVRGRPLAAAVDGRYPGRTWEVSHVGGCRFSASMVLLPHGYVLGGVPAESGPAIVDRYRNGLIAPAYLRGRSSLQPAVQAAQHHARIATGDFGVDALRLVEMRPLDPGLWLVVFAKPDSTVIVRERQLDTLRPLTCAATSNGLVRVFDLVEYREGQKIL